ncbi:MAG: gas vesicle protein [Cyanobacteria bacterium NC_groundwater_1444_Ag_S-0.65um_54_12]|nr:gas vesicle protein [Cyanobacteria bacterium NC_groundwater_1444_Ag_S-0.65um_54_12]
MNEVESLTREVNQAAEPLALTSVVLAARRQLEEVIGLSTSSMLGVRSTESGWRVMVEMLERKAVPDSMDLLGIYEVHLDARGLLKDFTRRRLRRRQDLDGSLD